MSENRINILGIPFDNVTLKEAIEEILHMLEKKGQHHIATPNPEMVMEAEKNTHLRNILQKTAINIPDGIGIIWASHLEKQALKERVTGIDLMKKICDKSREKQYKIFLLGAQPGIAEMAQSYLENSYPGIQIVGAFAGSPQEKDEKDILNIIEQKKPDILFVAYGCPKQEIWIDKNLSHMHSVKIAIGVGGAFDFLAGTRKRAPRWMQKSGTEWLYRLIQEPHRIKRIYNATIKFPLKYVEKKVRKKL